jgi:hypothetical protein
MAVKFIYKILGCPELIPRELPRREELLLAGRTASDSRDLAHNFENNEAAFWDIFGHRGSKKTHQRESNRIDGTTEKGFSTLLLAVLRIPPDTAHNPAGPSILNQCNLGI